MLRCNELSVKNNKLTALDISKNTLLKSLYAGNNELSEFDVSCNAELEYLYIENNDAAKLDVSKNTLLKSLNVENNKLATLDLGKEGLPLLSAADTLLSLEARGKRLEKDFSSKWGEFPSSAPNS